ncbi:MAG: hypothetical protein JXB42_03085 [Deltaproteobacteria bacterium]|nr:hypothetical protein [Deltaproteobacteria bacterium]
MKIVLYSIAIAWIVYGVLLILYTEKTRRYFRALFHTEHVKLLALLPLVFGLILVVGAFYYREVFWLSFILGVVAIAKGVCFFIAPSQQIKVFLEWWFEKADDSTARLFGLFTFILGSAMLAYLM